MNESDFLNLYQICIEKYYLQLDKTTITQTDFDSWILSINEPMKSIFKQKDIEDCKKILNFQRYVLESRDFGLNEFLKANLSNEVYEYFENKKINS